LKKVETKTFTPTGLFGYIAAKKPEPFLGEGENLNSIKAMLAKNS
jgi:hypothetical protein